MKPLEGILVVSVEQAVAAPLCTARLVEAGARVIKIERESGDFSRGYDQAAKGESSYFTWTNQGKESVVMDYKQADDKALLETLISKADVFVQNLAPGAMARAGFGSADLRKRYPKLITCDISGYGDSEKMAGMKSYDFLVQAETGLVELSGGPNEIGRIGVSICDIGAGMTAHAALMEALYLRERSGDGASVHVSLFDVAAEWMAVPLMHNDFGNGPPTRQGLHHPSIAPYGAYRTADQVDTIVSIQNEREWRRFCRTVLGDEAIADDELFVSNNLRVANRAALDETINKVTSTLTSEQFRERLLEASIAHGRLNSVDQLSHHDALRRKTVLNSAGDIVTVPAPPIMWAGRELETGDGVPKLGAHTESIKAEFLKIKQADAAS